MTRTFSAIQKGMADIHCVEMRIFQRAGNVYVSFSVTGAAGGHVTLDGFPVFDENGGGGRYVDISEGSGWVIRQLYLNNPDMRNAIMRPDSMIVIPLKGIPQLISGVFPLPAPEEIH